MKIKIIVMMIFLSIVSRSAFSNPFCTWACHLPFGEKCIGEKKQIKKNPVGTSTIIYVNDCKCQAQKPKSVWYVGQKVWDVLKGEGIITEIRTPESVGEKYWIDSNPITVKFPCGEFVYRKNGKWEINEIQRLYPHEMEIVKKRSLAGTSTKQK